MKFIQDRFVTSKKPIQLTISQESLPDCYYKRNYPRRSNSWILFRPTRSFARDLGRTERKCEIEDGSLFNRPVDRVPTSIFDLIKEQMIYHVAIY